MKLPKLPVLVALLTFLFMQGCNSSDKNAANGDAVTLKFNLQKGKSYLYSMKTEMESDMPSQQPQGGDTSSTQKIKNDMAFEYSMDIL
ncbi:MAG: hypothetical protein EOO10_19645, partial [Chitinophagaceae bacterium]